MQFVMILNEKSRQIGSYLDCCPELKHWAMNIWHLCRHLAYF